MTVSLDVPSEGYIDENELNKYTKNREGQKKHLKYLDFFQLKPLLLKEVKLLLVNMVKMEID